MHQGYPTGKDSGNDKNWSLVFILQCKCWPGFRLKDDGKTCVDVDECSLGFPCSQQCVNTYGTYRCLCTDGYETQPGNPNGCKSLSGIDQSTGPASATLNFRAISSNSFLLAFPWKSKFFPTYLDGNASVWFCEVFTNSLCVIILHMVLWPRKCLFCSVYILRVLTSHKNYL